MNWLGTQRQRLHWLLGTLAALLIILLAAELLLWAEGNSALAKFNKVEPGVTIEQVESLIGPLQFHNLILG